MSKASRLILALVALFWVPGQAADETSAKGRVYFYQEEARAALESRRWHVSYDGTGKIVADHTLGPLGAGSGGTQELGLAGRPYPSNAPIKTFAWLTLTFTPVSVSQTKCAANIVAYTFWESMSDEVRKKVKPTPFNNPESTKQIQEIMLEAETRLAAKHPEYAPH